AIRSIDAATEEAVQELGKLQKLYLEAFEASRREKVKIIEHKEIRKFKNRRGIKSRPPKFEIVRGQTHTEQSPGDASFLHGARECILKVAQIRGVLNDTKPADDGAGFV